MGAISRRGFVAAMGGAFSLAALSACASGAGSSADTSADASSSALAGTSALSAPTPEADASGFVLLADAVPDAIQEIRYYTTYNFVGDRIDGYEQPIALITRETDELYPDTYFTFPVSVASLVQ